VSEVDQGSTEPVTIKKYANRRLYNTATSSYVTLDHLCQMVKDGDDFVVFDAKTGEDITRSVLTQIIFEEEGKGHNLLPIRFLRQLIQFYDDNLQTVVPRYLELSMENFAHNQQQLKKSIEDAVQSRPGLKPFEDLIQRNFALIDKALSMITPSKDEDEEPKVLNDHSPEEAPSADPRDAEIEALQQQIADMQSKLTDLAKRR